MSMPQAKTVIEELPGVVKKVPNPVPTSMPHTEVVELSTL